MRNLLLILLLFNILYLLYNAMQGEELPRGEMLVDERQLGPMLTLATTTGAAVDTPASETTVPTGAAEPPLAATETEGGEPVPVADDGASAEDAVDVAAGPEGSEAASADDPQARRLQAVVGRSCMSIGQFDRREDADRAQLKLTQQGMSAAVRSEIGQRFVGHWVQIRNIASMGEAQQMLETLHSDGLGEAYIIETEDEGIKISIGLFGEAAGAERIELQATSLGLPAVITPRTTEGTVHYVDVALPPGRGAGEYIREYGEQRVLLLDRARCPGS